MDSNVMLRIRYKFNGNGEQEEILCEHCADILVDAFRYSPQVILERNTWQFKSHLLRSNLVREYKYCFKCLGKEHSHMFIKYDDLGSKYAKDNYGTLRICARCLISYLNMMFSKDKKQSIYGNLNTRK